MSSAKIARLTDRGVVNVHGADSEKLLQGLVTNEIEGLNAGEARYAGLLSPQGKILFDFFVVRTAAGHLLDVAAAKAADLVKRLTMYKLRADVAITDVSPSFAVHAVWDEGAAALTATRTCTNFKDPRHPSMGIRWLVQSPPPADAQVVELAHIDYDALRVRLGVPEGGKDYDFGDAYPHEAPTNAVLREGAARHGAALVDWNEATNGHPELLRPDGYHMEASAAPLYVSLVAAAL